MDENLYNVLQMYLKSEFYYSYKAHLTVTINFPEQGWVQKTKSSVFQFYYWLQYPTNAIPELILVLYHIINRNIKCPVEKA